MDRLALTGLLLLALLASVSFDVRAADPVLMWRGQGVAGNAYDKFDQCFSQPFRYFASHAEHAAWCDSTIESGNWEWAEPFELLQVNSPDSVVYRGFWHTGAAPPMDRAYVDLFILRELGCEDGSEPVNGVCPDPAQCPAGQYLNGSGQCVPYECPQPSSDPSMPSPGAWVGGFMVPEVPQYACSPAGCTLQKSGPAISNGGSWGAWYSYTGAQCLGAPLGSGESPDAPAPTPEPDPAPEPLPGAPEPTAPDSDPAPDPYTPEPPDPQTGQPAPATDAGLGRLSEQLDKLSKQTAVIEDNTGKAVESQNQGNSLLDRISGLLEGLLGEGNGEGWCDPAVEECTQGEGSGGHPELPVVETELVEWDSGLGAGGCPSAMGFSLMGQSGTYDWTPACDVASNYFRPLLIALSLITAAFIITGARV